MKTWRASLLGLAAAGSALTAIAVAAQDRPQRSQEAPESLLPPGFGDPVAEPAPTPAPVPSRSGQPVPSGTAAPSASGSPPIVAPRSVGELLDQLAAGEDPAAAEETEQAEAPRYDLAPSQRRSLAQVGWIGREAGGIAADGWGDSDGRFIQGVMRRLDAPIASRWLSIALRRALLSRADTPANINGADFAAERAWLLLRMGEARPALAMTQAVDIDNVTPKLAQVTVQAALANGDPATICPIAEGGRGTTNELSWDLSRAMCAGLAGDAGTASALIDQARRRRRGGSQIDVQLAEKVVGAGANSRRAITIEWGGTDQLTAWRYGLATATGVAIPDSLFATVGRHVQAWRAQAPMLDVAQRAGIAALAATLGVLSNRAYVDLVAAADAGDDATAAETALAGRLRDAYVGGSAGDRLTALRAIWDDANTPADRHARAVLTARAAARVPAEADYAGEADRLIASLLTGGFDTTAMRWMPLVPADSTAWGMLAAAMPQGRQVSVGQIEAFAGAAGDEGRHRAALLLAGLAGLDRMSVDEANGAAQALGVSLGREDAWTRAIETAARRGEQGTVILLAAAGMQTPSWSGVAPFTLYRATAALRRVGLDGYARMIAAEAVARA